MAGSPWTNQVISLIVLDEATTGFSGLFGYSPTPGTANLIISVAAVGGTDPYGNVYLPGVVSYLPTSGLGQAFACQIALGGVLFYSATTEAGPWSEQCGVAAGGGGQLAFITQNGSGGGSIPQTGVPETTAGIYAALFAAGIFA